MFFVYSEQVKLEDAQKLKEFYSIDYFLETSAKNGFNVVQLFYHVSKLLYEISIKKEINKVNKNI
jgi:hypothetical protein